MNTAADLEVRVPDIGDFDGVDVIDVGGMSTRPSSLYPDAQSISEAEETSRVVPVIEALASNLTVPVSVDTYRAASAGSTLPVRSATMALSSWAKKGTA